MSPSMVLAATQVIATAGVADPIAADVIAAAVDRGPLVIVLALLCAAIVMFAINRPRMDAVALLMLVGLPLTGVITMGEALRGFADSNIVLIAALFVIGDGLVRTGVARGVGDLIARRTGNSETRLIALLMIAVCALGSFMSSTAVTAIFIPVALRLAQTTGSSPGQLMMPLSFAALISGMMTLVATAPNLVVSAELERQGLGGFSFFAFTPFGVPILALGIVYMLFARRWLPKATEDGDGRMGRASLADWVKEYGLADREYRVRVSAESPLVGKTIAELDLRGTSGANIIAVERISRFSRELISPTAQTRLEAGDILLVDLVAQAPDVAAICERLRLEPLPLAGAYFNDRSQEIGLAQVIVPAESPLIGRTVVESGVRSRTGLTVIGLRRGTESFGRELLQERLHVGDTLLVVGPWRRIERVRPEENGLLLLRLPIEIEEVLPAPGKAPQALLCLVIAVGLMVFGDPIGMAIFGVGVTNVHAALIGCLLMGLLGCVNLNSGYRSIDWKTIVLIVGMLPFSLALKRTGGIDLAAGGLMAATSGAGPYIVLGALFALTAGLGSFMSNTATAVLMAPVSIALANELGLSPYPFAMIVALAASTAFVTPVSSPVNTLVVTPGNYTFGNFVKVGLPFALVAMVVSLILVPQVFPLELPGG